MPRYGDLISIEEFQQRIITWCEKHDPEYDAADYDNVPLEKRAGRHLCNLMVDGSAPDSFMNDLRKVEFDFENCDFENDHPYNDEDILGYWITAGGIPVLGFYAGGDWETPVHFVVYPAGGGLRAYLPKEGNTYNVKTKTAYGSEPDDPEPQDDVEPDVAAFKAAVSKRVVPRA